MTNIKKEADGRLKPVFNSLSEREEIEIISSIIDYLVWYKKNKEYVDTFIKTEGLDVNATSLVNFWIDKIGKNEKIEKSLDDINVIADTYEYVKQSKDMLMMLKDELEYMVIYKEHYRTHEQARTITYLFEKYKDHEITFQIKKYLFSHGFNEDHLTKEYGGRIIKRYSDNNLK